MHPFTTARRLLLGGLAAFVGGSALAQPPEPKQPPAATQPVAKPADVRVGRSGELLVPLGGVVRFKPPLPAGTTFIEVLTLNDTVVQVQPDTDAEYIKLVGLAPGVTRITLTLTNGKKGEYEVLVQPDYDLLRKVIQKAVPTASIDVIPGVGTSIILGGYVNRPEDAETVMLIARAAAGAGQAGGATNIINAIQVGGLQHVQIEVVFASVNRTKLRQRGVSFSVTGNEGSFVSSLIGAADANIRATVVPAGVIALIQALKTESLAKVLTEPKIVTQSGRPAQIFSGGQQAVLSGTGGANSGSTVTLERVGTTMQVLPIVYGNGKIYLEVSPSIRSVNNGLGITVAANGNGGFGAGGSTFSPGFSEQSAQASVMLESGQTFAIGGLLESSLQANVIKVPVIGEIPYVGSLFSQERYEERESELVILVTPRLVDALDCAQVPKRVPGRESRGVDDYEFFLEGLLEAPRGQRQVWNGRCYQAAWKCDPLKAFPCKSNVCGEAGGNCGKAGCSTCNTPTALPQAPGTPAPVVPAAPMPAAPATAPAPAASTTSLPVTPAAVDPIIMPQTSTLSPTPVAPPMPTPEAAPVPTTEATPTPTTEPLPPPTPVENKAPVETPAPVAEPVAPPTAPVENLNPVTAPPVPGPVAPEEVPAPAPIAPPGEGK